MKKFTRESAYRALRTFLQAFIPALAAGAIEAFREGGSITLGAVIAFVLPALAAGLAAVMNREAEYEGLTEEFVKDPEEDTITNEDLGEEGEDNG